jgi:DNA-binding beta-propeller fold protein YncE
MKNVLIASMLMIGIASAEEAMPLALVQSIPLPGVEGRIDHFASDAKDQRLYLAALGNDTVEVIDLAAGKVIHRIAGQKEPQGLAIVPESHEVVVANGDDGSVRFYDASTWTLKASVDLKGDADNVRYDQARQTVYVGFGDGGIAVIDAKTHAVTARIPLPAHPESFALETGGSRIFVNVPNAHQIAILDRATASPLAAWDLSAGFPEVFASAHPSANFPMALDEANHRLFIGCRKPACLVVFDTAASKPVARLDLSGDTDDIFYDAKAGRLYVSCGEGFIDVIAQTDADHYQRTAKIATAGAARTAYWITDQRRLYLAVPHRGGQQAAVMIFQAVP